MKRMIQTPSLIRDYCIKYFEDIQDLNYVTSPVVVHCDGLLGVEWRWVIEKGEIRYDINSNTCCWDRQPKDILMPCRYLQNSIVSVYPVTFFLDNNISYRQTVLEFTGLADYGALNLPLIEWDDKRMKIEVREFPKWALNEKFNVLDGNMLMTEKKCTFAFMEREFSLPAKKTGDMRSFFTPDTTDEQINSLYNNLLGERDLPDIILNDIYITAITVDKNGEPDIRLGFKS